MSLESKGYWAVIMTKELKDIRRQLHKTFWENINFEMLRCGF